MRARWEKEHPQFAHKAPEPGSYEEVAHLVSRTDWNALKPVHRAMISGQIKQARLGIVSVMPCFAPGTSMKVIQAFEGVSNSLQFYQVGGYWSTTASGSHVQGAPLTLRWSVVADGTAISNGTGSSTETGTSNLRARLNALYGNETTWRALFRQCFARWSAVSGLTYIEEPNDDGKIIDNTNANPGVAGVRGDVRISGHNIDGVNGILAYNYFPQVGDMVIDTGDTNTGSTPSTTGFFVNTSNNSLGFRNVVTHEHGHGLGFAHTCPINETKLMEPYVSYNFDGPQVDDIQNAQRGYGDPSEDNDSQATGTNLGTLANGTVSRSMLSLDSGSDLDFFKFSTTTSKLLSATLRPVGGSYLEGAQNQSTGACSAGTTFNASAQRDLQLAVLNGAGQVIASSNSSGVGGTEQLSFTRLSAGSGPFSLRISGDGVDKLQLYNLDFTIADAPSGAFFIQNGNAVVNDTQGNGNSNGLPDPGESSLRLTVPLRNNGDVAATGVKATLVSLTSGVSVGQANAVYGNIGVDATASNSTFPVIAIAPTFSCGTTIQLRLDVQSAQGSSSLTFSLATGTSSLSSFSYSGAAVAIPDGVGAESPGAQASATINVSGSGSISDLDLGLESLNHTYVGDLVISLTSPAGTTVTVINRMTGGGNSGQNSGDNFTNTVLDDEATSPIQSAATGSAPFTGSFTPANPLSAFDGQNANGTWTLKLQDFYAGDTGALNRFSLRISTLQCGVPAPVTAPTTGAKISEYRLSGPGGTADEFIELFNTTTGPLDVSNWSVVAGSATIAIPASTTPMPSRGHLLLTGSAYSLANYGGTSAAKGDVAYTGDIADGTALTLRNASNGAVDVVTSSGLPAPLATTDNYSYVRRLDSGLSLDTDSDINDFNLVDVQSTAGPNNTTGISNGIIRLGAPGPKNLSSAISNNSLITFTPSSSVRVGSGNSGTLALRYVVTNKADSGKTMAALRFRVVAVTTGATNPANSTPADLRLISSTSSDGTILPLLLQEPPTQPNGGGLNSSVSLANLPGGGLAPGQSMTVELLFNVVQKGSYRFLLNTESITTP